MYFFGHETLIGLSSLRGIVLKFQIHGVNIIDYYIVILYARYLCSRDALGLKAEH